MSLLFVMNAPGCRVKDAGERGVGDAAFEEGVGCKGAEDVVGDLVVRGTAATLDNGEV